MTTISLTYNERNSFAQKAIDYMLSLGLFQVHEAMSPAKKKTLKAINDAQCRRNVTQCKDFDAYLQAVAQI